MKKLVSTEELAEKIMNYLQKHPGAGDTLEGITRWWLDHERIELSTDNVIEAIELLIKRNVLKREKYSTTYIYRLKNKNN